jgi:hypothetical protein
MLGAGSGGADAAPLAVEAAGAVLPGWVRLLGLPSAADDEEEEALEAAACGLCGAAAAAAAAVAGAAGGGIGLCMGFGLAAFMAEDF